MGALKERLAFNGEEDFLKLTRKYLSDDSCDYNRNTRSHFAVATRQPKSFQNHPEVLALSFGGSRMKMAIASTRRGFVHIRHLREVENPRTKIYFYDYLDNVFIKDKVAYDYLTKSTEPSLCISLPVMIGEDNIPFHPHKIGGIHGMIARSEQEMLPELHLGNNVRRYFSSRGLQPPRFYFQSDPMTAHIGGLSLIDLKPGERSILLVCGTGMATADDNYQRVISLLPTLNHDEELYPYDETDGHHYEHGCSGMGLFGIMRRAIKIRSSESDSALGKYDLAPFFSDLYDSKTVSDIWISGITGSIPEGKAEQIRRVVDPEAFIELQWISSLINDRIVGSLGNAILATAIKLNNREGRKKYYIIFEGSVALDKYRLPRIMEYIRQMLHNDRIYKEIGVEKPDIGFEDREKREVTFDPSIVLELRDKVETTLIGTATMMMAENVKTMGSVSGG